MSAPAAGAAGAAGARPAGGRGRVRVRAPTCVAASAVSRWKLVDKALKSIRSAPMSNRRRRFWRRPARSRRERLVLPTTRACCCGCRPSPQALLRPDRARAGLAPRLHRVHLRPALPRRQRQAGLGGCRPCGLVGLSCREGCWAAHVAGVPTADSATPGWVRLLAARSASSCWRQGCSAGAPPRPGPACRAAHARPPRAVARVPRQGRIPCGPPGRRKGQGGPQPCRLRPAPALPPRQGFHVARLAADLRELLEQVGFSQSMHRCCSVRFCVDTQRLPAWPPTCGSFLGRRAPAELRLGPAPGGDVAAGRAPPVAGRSTRLAPSPSHHITAADP